MVGEDWRQEMRRKLGEKRMNKKNGGAKRRKGQKSEERKRTHTMRWIPWELNMKFTIRF